MRDLLDYAIDALACGTDTYWNLLNNGAQKFGYTENLVSAIIDLEFELKPINVLLDSDDHRLASLLRVRKYLDDQHNARV